MECAMNNYDFATDGNSDETSPEAYFNGLGWKLLAVGVVIATPALLFSETKETVLPRTESSVQAPPSTYAMNKTLGYTP